MLSTVGSSNNKRPNKEGLQKSVSAQRPLEAAAGLTQESEWGKMGMRGAHLGCEEQICSSSWFVCHGPGVISSPYCSQVE